MVRDEEGGSPLADTGPSGMEFPLSEGSGSHQQQQRRHARCNVENATVINMGSSSSSAQTPDRFSHCSSMYCSNGNTGIHHPYHHPQQEHPEQEKVESPKHVTDGSETSEYAVSEKKRKSSLDAATDDSADETHHDGAGPTTIRQPQRPNVEDHPSMMNGTHHRFQHDELRMLQQYQSEKEQQQDLQNGVSPLNGAGPSVDDSGGQQELNETNQSLPTLPQHERIQEVEPLDISYRCTPASLKLKDMLLSRLSMATLTRRIQVVSYAFNVCCLPFSHKKIIRICSHL